MGGNQTHFHKGCEVRCECGEGGGLFFFTGLAWRCERCKPLAWGRGLTADWWDDNTCEVRLCECNAEFVDAGEYAWQCCQEPCCEECHYEESDCPDCYVAPYEKHARYLEGLADHRGAA